MITLQHILYSHSNKDLLFDNINLAINNQDKIALIGNNGVGKSTLLKIIAGELQASNGQLIVDSEPYFIPQIFGQYNHLTIAKSLRIESKLNALNEILNGNVTESSMNLLNNDWTIEDRCYEALSYWGLNNLDLTQKMETLSGGKKLKFSLQESPFINQNLFYWMNQAIIWTCRRESFCMNLLNQHEEP